MILWCIRGSHWGCYPVYTVIHWLWICVQCLVAYLLGIPCIPECLQNCLKFTDCVNHKSQWVSYRVEMYLTPVIAAVLHINLAAFWHKLPYNGEQSYCQSLKQYPQHMVFRQLMWAADCLRGLQTAYVGCRQLAQAHLMIFKCLVAKPSVLFLFMYVFKLQSILFALLA